MILDYKYLKTDAISIPNRDRALFSTLLDDRYDNSYSLFLFFSRLC